MNWKKIIIPKGWHRSMFRWRPSFKNVWPFEFYFTMSCKYYFLDGNQEAINKLVGFSDGLLHHKNSCRIGWNYNPYQNLFNLHAYTYVDGKRNSTLIGEASTNEVCKVVIIARKSTYRVHFDDRISVLPRSTSKGRVGYKHMLYPYFGGVRKAPHNMELGLKY